MRIIGTSNFDANRTTMANSLAAALLVKPEISTNIVNLFEKNFSAFSSLLARKGMVKKGAFPGMSTDNFRVVGNRKVMWAVKGYPFRKGTIVSATTTPVAGLSQIGLNGTIFWLHLDTNYFSPYDVLELSDRRTLIQIMDEYPEELATSGVWRYKCKLVTTDSTDYIASSLIDVGSEVGFSHTMFPELSETGYEKNTFPEWHTNYMTIQRMQYSISGTASHMVLWLEHNGQKLWVQEQELEMLRRWAYSREQQLVFGKATIDANENTYLKDLKGREIVAGDGLLAQGEGSLKYQYNKLSVRVIENIMQNMQLLSNGDGVTELALIGGQALIWDFSRLMRDVFKYAPEPLFVNGENRGVNSTFNSYEIGGVRIITAWDQSFDAAWRPHDTDTYGVNKNSRRGLFVSLGNTIGGDPMVELVALGNGNSDRRFVKKIIDGMASPDGSGRQYASNSMDGYQVQILSETGILLKNPFGVAELYVP